MPSPIYSTKDVGQKIGYIEGDQAFDLSAMRRATYDCATGLLRDPNTQAIVGYVTLKGYFVGASRIAEQLFPKPRSAPPTERRENELDRHAVEDPTPLKVPAIMSEQRPAERGDLPKTPPVTLDDAQLLSNVVAPKQGDMEVYSSSEELLAAGAQNEPVATSLPETDDDSRHDITNQRFKSNLRGDGYQPSLRDQNQPFLHEPFLRDQPQHRCVHEERERSSDHTLTLQPNSLKLESLGAPTLQDERESLAPATLHDDPQHYEARREPKLLDEPLLQDELELLNLPPLHDGAEHYGAAGEREPIKGSVSHPSSHDEIEDYNASREDASLVEPSSQAKPDPLSQSSLHDRTEHYQASAHSEPSSDELETSAEPALRREAKFLENASLDIESAASPDEGRTIEPSSRSINPNDSAAMSAVNTFMLHLAEYLQSRRGPPESAIDLSHQDEVRTGPSLTPGSPGDSQQDELGCESYTDSLFGAGDKLA
jgi:hypothetical protein